MSNMKLLIAELRKEILAAQKIRTKIIGFKITFVRAGAGLIVANLQSVPREILVVAALTTVFFDILINSYSISIKRIGFYCRCYLEQMPKKEVGWPESTLLWGAFLSQSIVKQRSSMIEDLCITSLSVGAAGFVVSQRYTQRVCFATPLQTPPPVVQKCRKMKGDCHVETF